MTKEDVAAVLEEVGTLSGLLDARRRLIEATELERRIAAVETERDKR